MNITVSKVNEMKPWIRSFGPIAEVLAPDKLRQKIKQEWEALRHEYDVL
jgi:predicted DNA-binding transcriptional regulator YafY